jgi:hypothetical protein
MSTFVCLKQCKKGEAAGKIRLQDKRHFVFLVVSEIVSANFLVIYKKMPVVGYVREFHRFQIKDM